jgi:hypothetical protein
VWQPAARAFFVMTNSTPTVYPFFFRGDDSHPMRVVIAPDNEVTIEEKRGRDALGTDRWHAIDSGEYDVNTVWLDMIALAIHHGQPERRDVIDAAIELAVLYGGIDGEHHKTWVIDQMVRILAGSRYEQIVEDACRGEDGPNTYAWPEGIAP